MKPECPLCNPPAILNARQIKIVMTAKQIPYKEIVYDLEDRYGVKRSLRGVWAALNRRTANPTMIKLISNIVKAHS